MCVCVLQRLKALDDDWNAMHRMWESKQVRLTQSRDLQAFMRDIKQVEIILSQQENFLAKDEKSVSYVASPLFFLSYSFSEDIGLGGSRTLEISALRL